MADKPLVIVAVAGAPGHQSEVVVEALVRAAGVVEASGGTRGSRLGLARELMLDLERSRCVLEEAPPSLWSCAISHADALLLVVDAARGPQARTRDAVETAAALGVRNVIVYIVTTAATDASLLDACEVLLREVLEDAGVDANVAPVVRGPAHSAPRELLEALDRVQPTPRDVDATLQMPVSFAFRSGRYARPVVTGLILAGKAVRDARVRVIGTRRLWAEPDVVARIGHIETWRERQDSVDAGEYAGLTLMDAQVVQSVAPPAAGIPQGAQAPAQRAAHFDRNSMLVVGAGADLSAVVEMRFTLSPATRGGKRRALQAGARPVLAFGGAITDGIVDAGGAPIDIGVPTVAAVALRKQLPLAIGMRAAVRENGRTVGGAVVTRLLSDADAPTARRQPGFARVNVFRRALVNA